MTHDDSPARRGAWFALTAWSAFRCEGADAADLLSRLSTNDLAPLRAGRAVTTIFLSPTGRVLHRVLLVPGAEGLLALAESGGPPSLPEWVDKYTFAEDCRVVPAPGIAVLAVSGPAGVAAAPAPLGSTGDVASAGEVAWVRRDLGTTPFAVVAGVPADLERIASALGAAGVVAAGEDDLEQLRIEMGQPRRGRELTENYFPLEAGLLEEVSFTKGCYTGQEVVARQDTYGKVTRRLVGLLFSDAPEAGEPLTSEAKDGCRVTSVAPRRVALAAGTGVLALGYVASRNAAPGTRVVTASGREGVVVALPA